MTYEESLNYIHSLHWNGKKDGLKRIAELLELLGNPEKNLKFIHIAGTNGKGSTAAMLSSILVSEGYKTGLFTSPFILRFNERMQINGVPIEDDKLCAYTEKVKQAVEKMEIPPSEFEVDTALGFLYFADEKCDIVVLETGLGGTFDSTNIIENPLVCVITTIDYDHKQILGDTISLIASAKAGIIKKGCTAVFYGDNDEAYKVISEKCKEQEVPLVIPDFSKIAQIYEGMDGQKFSYDKYENIEMELIGDYQTKNAAVVIETIRVLNEKGFCVSERAVYEGFKKTVWPVRLEVVCKEPYVVIDGSHNPQGMRTSMKSIERLNPDRRKIFVLGVMADKDVEGVLEHVIKIADEVIAVTPQYYRAMDCAELAGKVRKVASEKGKKLSVREYNSVSDGIFEAILSSEPDSMIIVTGSLYLAGEAKEYTNGIFEDKGPTLLLQRKKLDVIDKEIERLIEKRFDEVIKIGRIKAKKNIAVLDKTREDEKLRSVRENVNNKKYADNMADIFTSIMEESKKIQHDIHK